MGSADYEILPASVTMDNIGMELLDPAFEFAE
jgi:hypothetical protein